MLGLYFVLKVSLILTSNIYNLFADLKNKNFKVSVKLKQVNILYKLHGNQKNILIYI